MPGPSLGQLPELPHHIQPLSDQALGRLHALGAPRQNGLADCLTCRGTKRFRWYADPLVQTEETVIEYECPCRDQFRLSRNLFASGLRKPHARMCWGDALQADQRDQDAIMSFMELFEGYCERGIGALLCAPDERGDTTVHGNGKTMFSVLIVKAAIATGRIGYFTTFADLLDMHTESWRDKETRERFTYTVRTAEYLVIDDIGREHEGFGPARVALESMFRFRVQAGLPTLMTTSTTAPFFVERYDKAMGSLVTEACEVIPFYGPSWRDNAQERGRDEIRRGLTRPWTLS